MDKKLMLKILMEDHATKAEAEKMLACKPGMPGSVNIYESPEEYANETGMDLDDIRAGKYAGEIVTVDYNGREYLIEYIC